MVSLLEQPPSVAQRALSACRGQCVQPTCRGWTNEHKRCLLEHHCLPCAEIQYLRCGGVDDLCR